VVSAPDAGLDGAALLRLRRIGGDSLVARMIDLFLEGSAARLEAARAGAAAGDLPAVARAVHSLKSSAGNLGAPLLQRTAEEIEILADAGDAAGVAGRMGALERACAAAREGLIHERAALEP
jgi:HPt (histidine-containing phosphotransfer) domain-containing protein